MVASMSTSKIINAWYEKRIANCIGGGPFYTDKFIQLVSEKNIYLRRWRMGVVGSWGREYRKCFASNYLIRLSTVAYWTMAKGYSGNNCIIWYSSDHFRRRREYTLDTNINNWIWKWNFYIRTDKCNYSAVVDRCRSCHSCKFANGSSFCCLATVKLGYKLIINTPVSKYLGVRVQYSMLQARCYEYSSDER